MGPNHKLNSFFKNYFVYLSIFTIEIICVVAYFTYKNINLLANSALVEKYGLSKLYADDIDQFLEAYKATVSQYYVMAGIVIASVAAFAVIIHYLMKKRMTDVEKMNALEDLTRDTSKILKSEIKYRSLFENNGTAILVVGDDENISDCNEKFSELIGYSKEEMIRNMHWSKIVHHEDIERVKGYDKLRRTNPAKAPAEYMMKLRRKDGTYRQVIVNVIVLQGTEQLASVIDITDMIEKDRALRENQELLNQAQEIASMGSWTYYPENDELKVSKEFLKILGIDKITEPLTLTYLKNRFGFDQFYNEVSGLNNSAAGLDKEITYLDEKSPLSDKTKYFKLKARAGSTAEKELKITGIILDITDRKKIENEINRANEEMKNLIYVTTHDLQIPLISIEGFSNLLLRSCQNIEITQEAKDYLERIKSNVKTMSSMFKNFFDISKITAIKNPFEYIKTSDLINQVASEMRILTDKYGSSVKIDCGNLLPDIYGDRENLRLVFYHLVSNGIIYGGKTVTAGYEKSKGFFIKDDGTGICTDDLERIFLPGIKLEKEENYEGSGMGLTICRKVIELHNGKIWAESDGKGKGTTIFFTLSNELIRD